MPHKKRISSTQRCAGTKSHVHEILQKKINASPYKGERQSVHRITTTMLIMNAAHWDMDKDAADVTTSSAAGHQHQRTLFSILASPSESLSPGYSSAPGLCTSTRTWLVSVNMKMRIMRCVDINYTVICLFATRTNDCHRQRRVHCVQRRKNRKKRSVDCHAFTTQCLTLTH